MIYFTFISLSKGRYENSSPKKKILFPKGLAEGNVIFKGEQFAYLCLENKMNVLFLYIISIVQEVLQYGFYTKKYNKFSFY